MRTLFFSFLIVTTLIGSDEIARTDCYRGSQYGNNYPYNDSPWNRQESQQEPPYRYILHAKDGHMQTSNYGSYELTLYSADKNITFFSDRPVQRAGKMPISQFFEKWDQGRNSLSQDSPNAIVITLAATGQASSQTSVVLSDPEYDPKSDRLVFHVRSIEKRISVPTGDLGEITIFIDSSSRTCP